MAILPNEEGLYRVLLTDTSIVQESETEGGEEYTFWKTFDKKAFRNIIEGEKFQAKLKKGFVKGELRNELAPRNTIPAIGEHRYLTIDHENVCFTLKAIQIEEIPFDENFEVWGLIELTGPNAIFLKQELERDNQIPMFGVRGVDVSKEDGKRHLIKVLTFDWLPTQYRHPETHEVFIYDNVIEAKEKALETLTSEVNGVFGIDGKAINRDGLVQKRGETNCITHSDESPYIRKNVLDPNSKPLPSLLNNKKKPSNGIFDYLPLGINSAEDLIDWIKNVLSVKEKEHNLVQIKFLDPRLEKWCPDYKTTESAGMDLCACINEPITILPETVKLIPTGFALNIDNDKLMAALLPRSGLGHKDGIVLGNLTGIIDSDYQGQVFISVWNRNSVESGKAFTIQPGDRIAQMIFVPVVRVTFDVVEEFSRKTERGEGGFGHTGRD